MRELTRQETKQFQGLSILAMVLLHLFCTYNYEGKFTPLVMLQGVPLVFLSGPVRGLLCVRVRVLQRIRTYGAV